MNNIKKNVKKAIKKFPITSSLYLQFKFRNEIKLLDRRPLKRSQHKSIIHFSINKAATQHIKKVLKRVASENGMRHIKLNEYAFNSDLPFFDSLSAKQMNKYKHVFLNRGCLYSVFGGMVENIPELKKYKVILVIRDPRDVLVSEYFSMKFSHNEPPATSNKKEKFLEKRSEAQLNTIDEYVIAHSEDKRARLIQYKNKLLNKHPNVYLTSYEEMIENYEKWLNDLFKYCAFDVSNELFNRLCKEQKAKKPRQENIKQHVRKGIIGDYKNKLKPETIVNLNKKFSDVLEFYGYE